MEEKILKATHFGKINIGDKELTCAVLEDGTRILSSTAMFKAFDRPRKGKNKEEHRVAEMPSFIDAKNLKSYVNKAFDYRTNFSVSYIAENKNILNGYKAEILPIICDIYLQARQDNVLLPQQEQLALTAEILVRSLSKIGIIALIDEATGYQEERQRDELQKLLSLYVREEFLPWTRRFPLDFYKEMFRLKGWDFKGKPKSPLVGQYTNKYVYDVLPKSVIEELKNKNPLVKNKSDENKLYRKYRFHQFLTTNIGIPHLDKHIATVITAMKLSDTWEEFEEKFTRLFPNEELNQNIIIGENDIKSGSN
jgi:hypothetical protein